MGGAGRGAALRRTGGQRAAVAVHQRHGRRSAGQAHRVRLSFRLLLRHARLRPARPRAERPAARALFDGRLCRRRRWGHRMGRLGAGGRARHLLRRHGRPGAGAPTPGARRPPRPRLHVERGGGRLVVPLHELAGLDRAESAERELALVDTRWADPGFEDPLRALFAQRVASAPPPSAGDLLQLEARSHHDTWERLPQVRCPVLVCGAASTPWPRRRTSAPSPHASRCPARRVRRRPCLHRQDPAPSARSASSCWRATRWRGRSRCRRWRAGRRVYGARRDPLIALEGPGNQRSPIVPWAAARPARPPPGPRSTNAINVATKAPSSGPTR